jgi:hypothetical protein
MSGSFPTQMTFDASGNLFALQGTSYNEFTRATIVTTLSANSNDSGQTMSSSSSTTYSNASVLGATVGP